MNERIQGLQRRAVRLVADDCANGDVFRLNTGSHQVQNLISQKFAELIVRECAEVIDAQKPVWQNTDVPAEIALDMAAKNVKAYFGVEE